MACICQKSDQPPISVHSDVRKQENITPSLLIQYLDHNIILAWHQGSGTKSFDLELEIAAIACPNKEKDLRFLDFFFIRGIQQISTEALPDRITKRSSLGRRYTHNMSTSIHKHTGTKPLQQKIAIKLTSP